jgi:hypothetical protein
LALASAIVGYSMYGLACIMLRLGYR